MTKELSGMTDELVERQLHEWQKSRSEWHGPVTLEVVREYAKWREAIEASEAVTLREALTQAKTDLQLIGMALQNGAAGREAIPAISATIKRIDAALTEKTRPT